MSRINYRRPPRRSRRHIYSAGLTVLIIGMVLRVSVSAFAGSLTNASVLVSDTTPGASNTTFTFNFSGAGSTVIKSFKGQVCTSPSGSCTVPLGFSAATAVLASAPTGLGDSNWSNDSQAAAFRIKNSSNATAPGASQSISFTGVVNPTNSSAYYVRITTYSDDTYTSVIDSMPIAFVIVPSVSVDATIDPTLTFSVSGVPAGTPYKGSLLTSDRCTSTSSAISFGSAFLPLQPDTDYDCAQELVTSTNAANGYQVTIRNYGSGNELQHSSGTASIPDWSGTNTSPAPTPATSTQLFGYTTNDSRLTGTSNRFTAADNLFAGLSSTDEEVAHAVGTVANDDVTVGFRLRFDVYAPAGSYSGKVVYTCTPTF